MSGKDETKEYLLGDYEFNSSSFSSRNLGAYPNTWPGEFDESVTGKTSFDWRYSKEFEDDTCDMAFIETVLFDLENNIVFFELEDY